jgi:TonB family protein
MTTYEENNYPKAFLATGLILAALAVLCYFIVFENPPGRVDGTGGILVNYGTTDEGSGKDISSREEPSVSPKANHTAPDKVVKAPPTEQKTQTDNSTQKIVTQDNEDAAEVANKSKKTSPTVATQTTQPVKKQVVNTNALYKGAASTGTGAGDGTTGKTGNQGSPNGSPLAENYGKGGSGNGLNLPNWSFLNTPEVGNPHRVPGIVIIDFTIDQNGNVIQTSINRKSRAELTLESNCESAIKHSKFVSSSPANGNQKGQMTFIFKVD